jgi:predicted nucleic acid-binding protein
MTFVLDTDVLSLFAKTESLDLLLRLFRVERLAITQGVFNELLIPLDYGYEFPRLIFAKSVIVSLSQAEIDTYENLRLQGQVSAADAEQIALCRNRQWLYVTMDKVAAELAARQNVTTIDLLTLFKAIRQSQILDGEPLRQLILSMEKADRTQFPFRDEMLSWFSD